MSRTRDTMGVYDYPRYYDVGFGWDPRREVNFLENGFRRYGRSDTRSVLELGCGTGRLLIELAKRGYRVFGVDRSHPMIEYLSEKARRLEISIQLIQEGMESFAIPEKVNAAFCAINTFRYLQTEKAALDHLRCVAESLTAGGVYCIDFNLLGLLSSYPKPKAEEWAAEGEGVSVKVSHRVIGVPDLRNRRVMEELTLTARRGDSTEVIRSQESMRTYTRGEFESLVESSGRFRILAWHGPDFDIEKRLEPQPESERVVVVLKKI